MNKSIYSNINDEKPKGSTLTNKVIFLLALVMLVDSYDQTSLAFAAPILIREWGIQKIAMGSVFSVQLLGLMIGGVVFGYIGDKLGRKLPIVIGLFGFGVLSLVSMQITNLNQLLMIRFFIGVGVGGVVPNAVALCNEFSPKKMQVTNVALIFVGYVLGGASGGLISAWLVPDYGWKSIFFVGGVLPILLGVILIIALPESVKFLLSKRVDLTRKKERKFLEQLKLEITEIEKQAATESVASNKVQLKELFRGKLKLMTPILWLIYISNSITVFALISWMPTIMQNSGFEQTTASIAMTLLFSFAAIGGFIISRFADKYGLALFSIVPAVGAPFVAYMGLINANKFMLYAVVAAAGFTVLGLQNTLHGVAGSIYPTKIKANGVGWALSVAKIGSIIGPFIGGFMMSNGSTTRELFFAAALPLIVCVVCGIILRKQYNSSFSGA